MNMIRSPLFKIICCLLGIVAAGVPLVHFTAARAVAPAEKRAEEERLHEVPVLLRYTGTPTEIIIRMMGAELCRCAPASDVWQGKLLLPMVAPGSAIELEIEAAWPQPLTASQAVTLELTPAGLPAARDTQWTEAGDDNLHAIFTFQW